MIKKLVIAATSMALTVGPAGVWSMQNAASAAPNDPFTCRASALRVDPDLPAPLATLPTVEPIVANGQNNPCTTQNAGVLNNVALPANLGNASVLFARTNSSATGSTAQAGVADVTITVPGAPVIRAEVLTSRAAAGECTSGSTTAPALTSSSTVARVTVGSTVIEPVAGPRTIDLGPAGKLFLNQEAFSAEDGATSNNTVTRRALFLDTPVADVVVAEAIADFRGNPCDQGTGGGGTGPGNGGGGGNQPPAPECSDKVDNDGDGNIDFPADPGCSNSEDNSEKDNGRNPGGDGGGSSTPPQCSNEIDDDGDGQVDFGRDSGCASPQDDNEASTGNEPQCSDGKDNDGDGFTDFPEDPGCDSRVDNSETDNKTECSDGVDNDRDGTMDFPADSGCKSAADDDEAAGFINGGGGYDEVDRKTPPEDTVTPGERLRFGTVLPCDLGDNPGPNLVTTFLGDGGSDEQGNDQGNGNLLQFKLDQLTRAFCRNDPFIDPRNPGTEFDTYVGEGTGTVRIGGDKDGNGGTTLPARAEFILVDRGEPGSPPVTGIDVYQIRVFVGVAEIANGCCTLDHGNIQAHSPQGQTAQQGTPPGSKGKGGGKGGGTAVLAARR